VGGFVQKYIVVQPQVLIRWPIQHGVNYLIQKQIEEAGFLFNFRYKNNPWNIFGGQPSIVNNCEMPIVGMQNLI